VPAAAALAFAEVIISQLSGHIICIYTAHAESVTLGLILERDQSKN
jgi:hypothetical protein